jgi:drug/metabolite transporter (DMT)-like permease
MSSPADERRVTIRFSPRLRAILQAVLVTFLWSTSWILIKRNLDEIPPLTFAGLRYTIAFIVLLPGLVKNSEALRALSARDSYRLVLVGLVFYAATQGGQFQTLAYLEAVTFSLLLNFTSVLVALFGVVFLREVPSRVQWSGIIIFVAGMLTFFLPLSTLGGQPVGLFWAGFTVCANAAAAILGRAVNRDRTIPPLIVTAVSMGVGAVVLLAVGLTTQGLPPISFSGWIIVLWLAVVNTALAFTLWNQSLRELSAVESSIINSTMLIQIAVLAWLFLGEQLTAREVAGLVLAAAGILTAQVERR